MKKKTIAILFLIATINSEAFAQELQRLTFTERTLGTPHVNVTVYAIFIGWSQQRFTIDGNFLVVHERFHPLEFIVEHFGHAGWGPWEFISRSPPNGTLSQYFTFISRLHDTFPRGASRTYRGSAMYEVGIRATPTGRASPIWWRDDGRAFYVFHRRYMIVP